MHIVFWIFTRNLSYISTSFVHEFNFCKLTCYLIIASSIDKQLTSIEHWQYWQTSQVNINLKNNRIAIMSLHRYYRLNSIFLKIYIKKMKNVPNMQNLIFAYQQVRLPFECASLHGYFLIEYIKLRECIIYFRALFINIRQENQFVIYDMYISAFCSESKIYSRLDSDELSGTVLI